MPYQHILFIDDDADDLEIISEAMENIPERPRFTTLNSATAAMKQLEQKGLTPDLIFLDLNMPLMTGQQFLMEIKKKEGLKTIPVVIFSTTANPTTVKLMKELGAVNFLTKPSKFNELVSLLRDLILK